MVSAARLYPGRAFHPGRMPRPPRHARGLIVGLVAVFAIALPISNLGARLNPAPTPRTSAGSSAKASSPPRATLRAGPPPGTIELQFASYVPTEIVTQAAEKLGMSIVSADPAAARFVLALPQAEISAGPDHTANIYFPKLASSSDIAAYLERNRLTLIAWKRDADGARYAVARLPVVQPTLIDPRNGYYSVTLPITERQSVDAWAKSSGLRIIKYDPATGEAVAQPLNWRPATASDRVTRIASVSRGTRVNSTSNAPAVQSHTTTTTTQTANGTTTSQTVTTTTTPGSSTGTGTTSSTGSGTTTPPSSTSATPAPGPPVVATSNDGHVELSWPAVASATSYQIYRSQTGSQSTLVGTTTGSSFVDTGGTAGVSYSYRVVPQLPAGAQPAGDGTASATWPQATSQPTVTRIGPLGSLIAGIVELQLDGRTGDGGGTVQWYLDTATGSTSLGTATSSPLAGDPLAWTSTLSWDSNTVPDGSYPLLAVVSDGAGQPTTATQQYRVAKTKPPRPRAFSATPVAGGIALTWEQPAFADATGYQLFRDGSTAPTAEL